MYAAVKTVDADQNAKVQEHEKPGVNAAAKEPPEQIIKGATEAEKSKSTKGKKKKRKKHSSTSSDSEESVDDDNDHAKSKKKTTAGVTTRINIFTGAEGSPGVGTKSTVAGPNVVSAMAPPMPFIQQVPMMPMVPMFEPVAINTGVGERRKKKRRSKPSKTEPRQTAGVIPPGAAGLVSGPEGQDVLVIPMPPGMKLPPLGNLNDLFSQLTHATSKKTDEENDKPGNAGALVRVRSRASLQEQGSLKAVPGTAAEAVRGKSSVARRVSLDAADAVGEQQDSGRVNEAEHMDMTPTDEVVLNMSQPGPVDEKKGVVPEDSESGLLAYIIVAAVIIIITIVVIIFILFSSSSKQVATANPHPAQMGRRMFRRHPRPLWNLTRLLHL